MPAARSSSRFDDPQFPRPVLRSEKRSRSSLANRPQKIIESHMLVVQSSLGSSGRELHRWAKRYADHAGLFIGIDSKTLGVGR